MDISASCVWNPAYILPWTVNFRGPEVPSNLRTLASACHFALGQVPFSGTRSARTRLRKRRQAFFHPAVASLRRVVWMLHSLLSVAFGTSTTLPQGHYPRSAGLVHSVLMARGGCS